MLLYQYLSLANSVKKISQVLLKNEKTKTFTILDLEDSLMIPFDLDTTINNRKSCRNKLKKLSSILENLEYVGLRVNHCLSLGFQDDIACLKSLKTVKWNFFLLPKIESEKDIVTYLDYLPKGSYKRICFLIETELGVVNLTRIMEVADLKGVFEIHLGMWDYYLSLSKFPFPSQKSITFWNEVKPIIEKIVEMGLIYVHTPFCKLLEYKEYRSIITKVENLTEGNFGITSLTNGQTRCIHNFESTQEIEPIDIVEPDSFNQAEQLIRKFKTGKSTYFVDENNRFIAPHEFIAAHKLLNL